MENVIVKRPRRLFDLMAVAAYKISLRSSVPVNPAKWHPLAVNEKGERDWNLAPVRFLMQKLREEYLELLNEVDVPAPVPEKIAYEAGDVAAVAMMLAERMGAFEGLPLMPPIVCLCGSTRLRGEFEQAAKEETFAGRIVISVGFFAHSDTGGHKEETLGYEVAAQLDELHKRKIDLADEILVINQYGYVGNSTRSEIAYATERGIPVRLRYPEKGIQGIFPPQPQLA